MALMGFHILSIFSFIPFQLHTIIKQNINLITKWEKARVSKILFNVKLKGVALRCSPTRISGIFLGSCLLEIPSVASPEKLYRKSSLSKTSRIS